MAASPRRPERPAAINISILAVQPGLNHGAIEDPADDALIGQIAAHQASQSIFTCARRG